MQAARGTPLNPSDSASDATSLPSRSPLGRARGRGIFLIVALFAYGVDVLTKTIAVSRLTDGKTVGVFGDLLTLHLVRNPGAAFSTGTRFTVALTVVALVATCAVIYFGWRVRSPLWAVALGLLLAGVVGNLTDRLLRAPGPFRGHVVDFLQLPHWPVFNFADICINLAAGLILLQAFRGVRIDGTRETSSAESPLETSSDEVGPQ
jgi:signal peptidase II